MSRLKYAMGAAMLSALWVGPACLAAQVPASPQTLRVWGDSAMASVVEALERGFRLQHPEIQFENRLMGSDSALPGLYSGLADLALLGRESNQTENDGFLHTLQYPALRLLLMNGSLDASDKSYAPVLFVSATNPVTRLTLAQVEAVVGCETSRESAPAPTWGDLGATGEWKDKPIHVYMLNIDSGSGAFFLRRLQGESKKLNWANLHEFDDVPGANGRMNYAGQQTIDALRKDPYGLAVSGLQYAGRGVRPLALASTSESPYVAATKESVIDGSYPLARRTYVFVNRPPAQPVSPLVKELLDFVYSDAGQKIVAAQSGFLPLSPDDAERQRALLR